MKKKPYFAGEDVIPYGMETSLTYSEIDDEYLFKKQRVHTSDVYHELIAKILKTIDPDCHYQKIGCRDNPIAHLSTNVLFYLVCYFYCRFCYLSPYDRPYLSLRQNEDDQINLMMYVAKEAYSSCQNCKLMLEKATYLAKICGFTLTVEEEETSVLFRFCLTPGKKTISSMLSALPFAYVECWMQAAISAAKADHGQPSAQQ